MEDDIDIDAKDVFDDDAEDIVNDDEEDVMIYDQVDDFDANVLIIEEYIHILSFLLAPQICDLCVRQV